MIRLKDDDIDPHGISVELLLAIFVVDQVYADQGAQDCVITSLCDGKHSATSLHYAGSAVDVRIWSLDDPARVVTAIKARLNRHYDVILERDHIHIEYQPRRRS